MFDDSIEWYFQNIDVTGDFATPADLDITNKEYAVLALKYGWEEFSTEPGEFV